MAARTVAETALPSFDSVKDFESLIAFFQARGIDYDKRDRALKITPHNTVRLDLVDDVTQEVVEQKRKQLLDSKIAWFGLIVDRNFQKFKFIRPKERPNTFTFDRTKRYHAERLQSIYNLINALAYSESFSQSSLHDLFDIKELVNRFYRDYRIVRGKLAKQIHGATNGTRDLFAQVILDRIIFIYFLQAKGILKQDYLRALYERALEQKKSFYDAYLQPLFFELLNSDDEKAKAKYQAEFGPSIPPYLNGGLFRRREFEVDQISIPNATWKTVFDLFDGSEWVIEDTESGGLTPEVLGHIFEMSMNEGDRKKSGSYYTPEEATRLICEQVITRLIMESIEEKFKKKFESFEQIINQNDKVILEFTYTLLQRIHLVDPAVGSGAFLIAAENILVDYLLRLYEKLEQVGSSIILETEKKIQQSENSKTYHFKKQVMTQNLYGVDINPDGVELCKLRLWLSMITDVNRIEPLPNIEFNIRQGNSLLGFVERDADVGQLATLDDLQSISTKVDDLNALKRAYKQERNTKQAEAQKKQIDKLMAKYRDDLNRKLFTKLGEDSKKLQTEPWFLPFHWVMEFSEVFDAGGFDLVVGNPPFSKSEHIPKEEKKIFNVMFSDYQNYLSGQFGLYGFFVILANEIVKPRGRTAFVLPSTILRLESTVGLRKLLIERATIESIFIRTTKAAFSNDTSLREIILSFKKGASNERCQLVFVGELTPKERAIAATVASQELFMPAIRMGEVSSEDLKKNAENLFRLVVAPPELLAIRNEILAKAGHKLVKFKDYLQHTQGQLIRGVEIHGGDAVSVLSTFVLRDPAQAIKSGDVWSVKELKRDSLVAVNKVTGADLKIPREAVVYGMRRPALLDRIDATEKLDFVVTNDFEGAKEMLGTRYRKPLEQWQKYILSRSANLAIVRRLDISASGTKILACHSDASFTPTKMLYAAMGVPLEEGKLLAMWFNSAANVLQLLLEREETRGAFLGISEYVLEDFLLLDPRKITGEQRLSLKRVFNKTAKVALPNLLEQLNQDSSERHELDSAILQALGFDTDEANGIIRRLYPLLVKEITLLKTVMEG